MWKKLLMQITEIKNLGKYHDLYAQSDILLLFDAFENFRNVRFKRYQPFRSWISMTSSFKKDRKKLELLTHIDMLLMVEKGIRGGICHAIHRYAKANNKYMKDYD